MNLITLHLLSRDPLQIIICVQQLLFFFVGALKGVMRVGVLAKGLLLHERLDVDLVVLCHGERTD